MNNFLTRLKISINQLPTMNLVGIFISLALFCIVLDLLIFGNYSGTPLEDILIPLGFFFQGLAGLPIIFRKEISLGVVYIDGPIAVIIGILVFLIGIAIATIPFLCLLI